MREQDRKAFISALTGVHALYRLELSDAVAGIWWSAMKSYDLAAVVDAFGRHAVNPDTGQFFPKPADVVRMLGGSTLDAAMQAWSKFEKAVMRIGPYATVAFDDPLIHRVVEDMGGWIQFGNVTEDEWPFTQKEFENRYRAYRFRNETPAYPPRLIGIVDAQNGKLGFAPGEVTLIGDVERARQVLAGGSSAPRLTFTKVTEPVPRERAA